jgi:hypothetical protein
VRRTRASGLAVAALLLAACGIATGTPPPSGQLALVAVKAYPVGGSANRIYLTGAIVNGTASDVTITGGTTPVGPLVVAGWVGCVRTVVIWPDMTIRAGTTFDLDRGGGFLLVRQATELPQAGASVPVLLHLTSGADLAGSAEVQAREVDDMQIVDAPGPACAS